MKLPLLLAITVALLFYAGAGAAEPAAAVPTYFTSRFGGIAQQAGGLPEGWRDDSGWADITVTYDNQEEDGLRYLHAAFTRQGSGFAQLVHLLPDDEGVRAYRFTAQLRLTPGTEVRLGLRQKSAPWRMLAECIPDAVAGWQRLDHEFVVTRTAGEEVGLWIQIRTPGSLDLAEATLAGSDLAAATARHLSRIGGIDTPNLVRLSRFPLGLPAGWLLDRSFSDGDVVVIGPEQAGPTGYPALGLRTPVPTQLLSAPFDCAQPGLVHQLSLHIAGNWSGRLAVLEGDHLLAERELRAEAGWVRVNMSFTPTFIGENHVHAFRLLGQGELHIDGLQVTAGATLRPYAPQLQAEVQLAMAEGEAAAGHCQFTDEAPLVRWCTTGAAAGSTLRIDAYDQDGHVWPAEPIVLDGTPLQIGTARLSIPPARHAALRIVAQIGTASPVDELVLLRLPRPQAWGRDAPDSPFGVHVMAVHRQLQLVKSLGYNWVRLHDAGFEYTGWWWNERQQGQKVYRDDAISRYRQHHLTILGQLGSVPEWASHAADPGNQKAGQYFRRYFQPLSNAAFADYVSDITSHHRQDIRYWFVWNEPWMATRWAVTYAKDASGERYTSSAEPQRDFAALMAAAYQAAKTVDPDLLIVGVNTSGAGRTHEGSRAKVIGGSEWTDGVVAAGGLAHCDAMDFHCYVGGAADSIIPAVAEARRIAVASATADDGIPLRKLWLTEGAPALPAAEVRNGGYREVTLGQAAPDPTPLARRLVLWELGSIAAGCEHSFLYSTHTTGGLQEWPNHTALVASDGSPHPSALAVAAFHHLVAGLSFAGSAEIAPGLSAYRFTGQGRTATVLLDKTDGVIPQLPAALRTGIDLRDVWGNPDPAMVDGAIFLARGEFQP
jgi:hypothetical protein